MVTSVLTSGEGRRRRRGAGPAIGISLALHAVVFLAIGLIVPKTHYTVAEPQPVTVALMPSLQQAQNARSRPVATAAGAAPAGGRSAAPLVPPHVHVPRATPSNLPPSPVAAAPPGEAATGRPGIGAAPGPLPYDESERGVRAFLRGTVGCESADAVHLTAEERARCAERFAQDARNGQSFSGIDPAKRGAFAAQAAADEHRRALRDNLGSSPLIAPCQGQGSNMGVGCLPDSAIAHVRVP